MKKNNKISRKKAAALAAKQDNQVAGQLLDGTEVLKSRESRAKVHRWSFEADIELNLPSVKNDKGEELPMPAMERTVKLDAVSYSNAKEASMDCKAHEAQLRATNALFARSKIKVRAIPHETVSHTTVNQLNGYRDMAMILDKALAMSIAEAADVVTGKAVGSQFIETPAVEADVERGIEPKSARDSAFIKEEFYKRAMDEIKKGLAVERPTATDSSGLGQTQGSSPSTPTSVEESQLIVTSSGSEDSQERQFIPEIVEITRASGGHSLQGTDEDVLQATSKEA